MWIDVKIPYEPKRRLAEAYNRAIDNSSAEWVLLLDHDVFLACNPHWYEMCLEMIQKVEPDVALITCMEGNTESTVDRHIEHAKTFYELNGFETCELKHAEELAGYFMLVRRSVCQDIRFHSVGKGIHKIDHDFARRLLEAGYRILYMKGLYVYHHRNVTWAN